MARRGVDRRTFIKASGAVALAAGGALAASPSTSTTPPRRNPAIRHIRETIPPFEVPAIRGKSYRATVPDTLDLAEMARLAVTGMAGVSDLSNNAEVYWRAEFGWQKPVMLHDAYDWCEFKFYSTAMLLRQACGLNDFLDVEWHRLANLLQMRGPDGLLYGPSAGRPWAQDYSGDPSIYGADKPSEFFLPVLAGGRMIEAAATYHRLSGDPQWKKLSENFVARLAELPVERDGYAYFTKGNVVPGEKRHVGDVPPPNIHHQQIWTAIGALSCHRMLGYEPALDFAYKLAGLFSTGHSAFVGPGGSFNGSHGLTRSPMPTDTVHFHTNSILRILLLQAGVAKGDREMIDLARAGYEYAKTKGVVSMGFFPEMLNVPPTGYGNTCELCCTADMTTLALLQSTLGVADCWDDVDRWVRNVLSEAQLCDVSWVERYVTAQPRVPHKYAFATTDRVPERMRGLWAAWLAPNDWQGYTPGSGVACCWGNSSIALYRVWRDMISYDEKRRRLNVHLLANRASRWADVESEIPVTGRVVVRQKTDGEIALRLPAWAAIDQVIVKIDGKTVTPKSEGRYLAAPVRAGSVLTLEMPIGERTEKVMVAAKDYTLTIRGHDVVKIDPPGKWRPLFAREAWRKGPVATKTLERFVVDDGPLTAF
jgi:hypothetical protein